MKKDLVNIEKIFFDFSSSESLKELNEKNIRYLSEIIPIVESSLFSLDKNLLIDYNGITWLSDIFKETVVYLEEQGIIKWVVNSKLMKSISDPNSDESRLNYYVFPVYIYDSPLIVLVFSTELDEKEVIQKEKEINLLTTLAGMIWINLKDKELIKNFELKFDDLENQVFNHSLIDSLSQEIIAISDEISTSLKLIETNFHLVLSGIGDSAKRIDIINSNFEYLKKINDKVKYLLTRNLDNGISNINLKTIIDDIIEFTGLKLRKENIDILFDFDENLSKPIIYASYSEVEKALFNIILFCSNLMSDGGKIEIYLSETNHRFNLTITDNSNGLDEDEELTLLQPIASSSGNKNINLYFAKKAIIKNNGTLSFHSVKDKGNTIKISFPKVLVEG